MHALHWETLLERLLELASSASSKRLEDRTWLEPAFQRGGVAQLDVSEESATSSALLSRIQDAASAERGGTALMLIEGIAGAGKSVAMATYAERITRRSLVGFKASAVEPAALFVSSEGHLMASIDTAISRVVDATPGLSASGAKVLAKHGLLVLFVDGLDELLGDTSYRSAIEKFDTWASGLEGRGAIVASARTSYFATAYIGASSSSSAQVNPELWRIDGLTDEQIGDVWDEVGPGRDQLDLASLSDAERAALRVPFLCFQAAQMASGAIGSAAAVRESLINGYLDREVKVLRDEGAALITDTQLRVFLREIAELLVFSGDHSLSDDDLQLAALAAGIEGGTLLNRLRVICGLKVEGSGDGHRFAFSHDFYFDHFHAAAVIHRLGQNLEGAYRLINERSIERWALEPIIEAQGADWCEGWLALPFGGATDKARFTRGNLLLELVSGGHEAPVAQDVSFGDADLNTWSGTLIGVEAEVLRIGDGVTLDSGTVRCLVLDEDADRPGVGTTVVRSLSVGDSYFVGDRVRQFLLGPGVQPSGVNAPHVVQNMLSELERRGLTSPVVVSPAMLPNDQRLHWLDDQTWLWLLESAKAAGVVELRRFQSSGPQNTFRVRFKPPVISLADRESEDKSVRRFWQEVVRRDHDPS